MVRKKVTISVDGKAKTNLKTKSEKNVFVSIVETVCIFTFVTVLIICLAVPNLAWISIFIVGLLVLFAIVVSNNYKETLK
jgi:Flp pilus assembly protein TadB